MSFYIIGRSEQALPAAEQALRLRPEDRNSMLLKAQILESLGRHREADKLRQDAEFVPEGNWSEQAPVH